MVMVFEKETTEDGRYKINRIEGILTINQLPKPYREGDGPIVIGHKMRRSKRSRGPLPGASVIWKEPGEKKRKGIQIKVGETYDKLDWLTILKKINIAGDRLNEINKEARSTKKNICTDLI